jgi:hypothetical protein
VNKDKNMASVYRKQGKWWVRFKDINGRWRDRPTTRDTKSAAKLLAKEIAQKIERQHLGLDPMPVAAHITFGDLMKKWWAEYGPILRSKTIQPFAEKHLRGELGNKMLGEITTGTLEALLNKKTSVLSAQSRNHLRSYLKRLYNYAARRDLWRGANPAAALDKAKLPKRPPSYLRPDEIAKVLDQLEPRWKAIFATAFFTGMRKGELLALKKIDVDLVNGTITVRRSNNFDTTKGEHEDDPSPTNCGLTSAGR